MLFITTRWPGDSALGHASTTTPLHTAALSAALPAGKAPDYRQIILAHWQAMAALEVEKALAFYTEDFSFSDPTLHMDLPSKAQVRATLLQLCASYANVRFTLQQLISGPAWAVAQHTLAGSYRPPQRPEAGYREFAVRGVSVFEFAGAKFKRQTDYYDALTLRQQLGLQERN